MMQFDRRIDVAVGWTSTWIGLEADLITQELFSQALVYQREVIAVRLVHREKAVSPGKHVLSAGESLFGQEC